MEQDPSCQYTIGNIREKILENTSFPAKVNWGCVREFVCLYVYIYVCVYVLLPSNG